MPFKTFAQGGATVLAMDRPADYRRVIVERTNDRMLAEKRQGDLCRGLPLEQLAERLQPVNAVRKGRFTGIFQGLVGMLLVQAEQPLQHACAGNATSGDHRLCPLVRLRTNGTDLA